MDKLLKSNWFVKIISFLIALMLYFAVSVDNSSQPSANPIQTVKESQEQFEAKLVPYYDKNKYIVSNLPDKVIVILKGPSSLVTKTQLNHNFEVYVDLQNLKPGNHRVPVHYRNFSKKLNVSIEPQLVNVTIQEKVTATFPVGIELVNKDKLPEGYALEKPIVTPRNVKITGTKEQIRKISFIKGYIDVGGAKSTLKETVPLNVYDHNGNELQVAVDPAVVDVKVPITFPYKDVPIKINQQGSLPDGMSVVSLTPDPAKVTIFGPQNVLNSTEFLEMNVDLSKINDTTTIEVPVSLPKGIDKVDPQKIKVKVVVAKEAEKTLTNIPIKIAGLSDGFKATFLQPTTGQIDVSIKGAPDILDTIQRSNIESYVNLSQLSPGDHDVKIEINSPPNLKVQSSIDKATVHIYN